MPIDLLYQRILESDISAENLKRIYEMALFERDPQRDLHNGDIQSLKALHDLIGIIAEIEFNLEDKIEGLGS